MGGPHARLTDPDLLAYVDDRLLELAAHRRDAFEVRMVAGHPQTWVQQLVYRRSRIMGILVSARWTGTCYRVIRWEKVS